MYAIILNWGVKAFRVPVSWGHILHGTSQYPWKSQKGPNFVAVFASFPKLQDETDPSQVPPPLSRMVEAKEMQSLEECFRELSAGS